MAMPQAVPPVGRVRSLNLSKKASSTSMVVASTLATGVATATMASQVSRWLPRMGSGLARNW